MLVAMVMHMPRRKGDGKQQARAVWSCTCPQRQWDGKQQALRTCAAGNSLVRSVSCVASPDSRFGRLSTKAAWSCVAPQAVMR